MTIVGLAVAAVPAAKSAAADAQRLYATNCAVCHQFDGGGIVGLAPPLKGDLWRRLEARTGAYLAGVMLKGLTGLPLDGQTFAGAMPPWAHLSDEELAAIGSFVLERLNGSEKGVDAATVAEARAANRDDAALRALRAEAGS